MFFILEPVVDVKPSKTGTSADLEVSALIEESNGGSFQDAPDSHFFSYFIFLTCLTIVFYIGYHNKNKVSGMMAFVVFILGQTDNATCRLCKGAEETAEHILCTLDGL